MHARTSGLCDYLARDEAEALQIARAIVSHLHWRRRGPAPDGPAEEPLYPAEELLGIASVDVRVPFDVREILARVVDDSAFEEFKATYGTQLVCGWASVCGYPWASWPTTAFCSQRKRRKVHSSSSCATGPTPRCCSPRTSPGSSSANSTSTAASPKTERRWCTR